MSTLCEQLWIPAKWDEKEKKWIPLLDEAKKIIPNIDKERVEKWVREGTVELVVKEVRYVPKTQGFIGRSGTRLVMGPKISPIELREVVLYVNDEEAYRFYIPAHLISPRAIVELSDLVSDLVTAYANDAGLNVTGVFFDAYDMLQLIQGRPVEPINLEALEEEVENIKVQLTDRTVRGWVLSPGATYTLVSEEVTIPKDIMPKDVKLRSSYRRLGWDGHPSNIEPGFRGHIIFTIYSLPDAAPLVIEEGARIITMRLYKLDKPLPGYDGQFQGV